MTTLDEPVTPTGVEVATLARRIGGYLLDQLIIVVPVVAVALAVGFEPDDTISERELWGLSVATLAVSFVYHTLMIGFLGRTVGKLAAGTVVVRAADGGRLGWSASTMRALVPQAAGAVPVIGFGLGLAVYGMAVFDPLRRGLHDRAAGSLVVRDRRDDAGAT